MRTTRRAFISLVCGGFAMRGSRRPLTLREWSQQTAATSGGAVSYAALFDEIHEHRDRDLFYALTVSRESARQVHLDSRRYLAVD